MKVPRLLLNESQSSAPREVFSLGVSRESKVLPRNRRKRGLPQHLQTRCPRVTRFSSHGGGAGERRGRWTSARLTV